MESPIVPHGNQPQNALFSISSLNTEDLLTHARNSLGTYCMTVCKAKCCHKGKLLLTEQEAVTLAQSKSHPQLTARSDGCFDLSLESGCPSLKGTQCGVYALRPKMCRDFPVFLSGYADTQRVVFSSFCEGNAMNLLEIYKQELRNRKIKVEDV